MKTADQRLSEPYYTSASVSVVSPGKDILSATAQVVYEHILTVTVNGNTAAQIVCTPDLLPELAIGHLLTGGVISSPEDIASVSVCGGGSLCAVRLAERLPARMCTDAALSTSDLRPVSPLPWKSEWITALAGHFSQETPVHQATHGTHSCMLARCGQPLYCCEDISRHNAVDKAVGCAFRDGVGLSQVILWTSGRVPADMMRKAISIGVPVVVSNAAPTEAAVRLAEQYRVTLIGRARTDAFQVFAGIEYMAR